MLSCFSTARTYGRASPEAFLVSRMNFSIMTVPDPAFVNAEVARFFGGSKPPASLPPASAKAQPQPPQKIAPAPVTPPMDDVEARILQGMSKPKLPAKAAAGYQILSPADLLASPIVRDLVRGVFPCVGIGGIVGASMAGKGFISAKPHRPCNEAPQEDSARTRRTLSATARQRHAARYSLLCCHCRA